ncbi:MAG: ATP-dependent sacrificial sulfur transferase LarE [Chloroflexota bacterium]|nr:MAG: ATP-dependent sacrificial sulfur transferase LarE [Chloroflexota bacterium]
MQSTNEKLDKLKRILIDIESAVLGFSGGVDSSFLLRVAHDVLGDKLLAVTANSETYPAEELAEARDIARTVGAQHVVIDTHELDNPCFAANPPDRCYYCKHELFDELRKIADARGLKHVLDATNLDDVADFRPGRRAAAELAVRSPLKEAGLTKTEIRKYSAYLGLPTWNKPAAACLSSRFPYGAQITREGLSQVGRAETVLRGLGFGQLRVRHHDRIARIEVEPGDFQQLLDPQQRLRVVEALRELGYSYVTLDLAGYRTGSMNEVLDLA